MKADSMNTPDGSGLTILGHATTEGDLLEVQRMLALDACDVNCSDPTPLAIAIEQIYILRPHTYLGLRQFQQLEQNREGLTKSPSAALLEPAGLTISGSMKNVMESPSASPAASPVRAAKKDFSAGPSVRTAVALELASHPRVNANVNFPWTNIPVLAFAVQSGAVDLVEALIKSGADASAAVPCCFDYTPLSLAVAAPEAEAGIVEVILRAGGDTNAKFLNGTTLLRSAAYHKKCSIELVNLLLSSDYNLNATARCDDGSTALHSAAASHHSDEVAAALAEMLLSPQVASEDQSEEEEGPEEEGGEEKAAQNRPPKCDPRTAMDNTGCLPLHLAAITGKSKLCEALLTAAPETVDNLNAGGYTPAMFAASNGHADVLKVLIAFKASMTKTGHKDCMQPVHLAAQKGWVPCLELLKTVESVDLNAPMRDVDGLTPLFVAAVGGHEQALGFLGLEKVPYQAPLLLACNIGVAQVVWHLLMLRHEVEDQHAREVELDRSHGWRSTEVSQRTYFELFNNYKKKEGVESVTSPGAQLERAVSSQLRVESSMSSGAEDVSSSAKTVAKTLLGIAVTKGFVDVAATLIAFGEDVNEPVCSGGPPPVVYAAQEKQLQCAQLCICAKANRLHVKKAVEIFQASGDAAAVIGMGNAIRIAAEGSIQRDVNAASESGNEFLGINFDAVLGLFQH